MVFPIANFDSIVLSCLDTTTRLTLFALSFLSIIYHLVSHKIVPSHDVTTVINLDFRKTIRRTC